MPLYGLSAFYRSQIGGSSVINYSYTDSPWKLLYSDIRSFLIHSWALPWIVWPIFRYGSGTLDELYPTWPNIYCIAVHTALIFLQVGLILAVPVAVVLLPLWLLIVGVGAFFLVNTLLCTLINGPARTFSSDDKYAKPLPQHAHEQWVFINGVAVGEHWMKQNLNRIAITFGRPVLGIHNKTCGIIFDVFECLVQRNLGYATDDVRATYKIIKDVLYDPKKSKVVLILHSQGGIVGGMCLDWLLQELPQDLLAKIEVYTFGNAANHFNNPHRHAFAERFMINLPQVVLFTPLGKFSSTRPDGIPSNQTPITGSAEVHTNAEITHTPPPHSLESSSSTTTRTSSAAHDRAISYIEHYAHSTDFVAIWGVLHFATTQVKTPFVPRFIGRLFVRARGGHQFTQHYLDGMFPLKRDKVTGDLIGADDDNEFMDNEIEVGSEGDAMENAREAFDITYEGSQGFGTGDVLTPIEVHGMSANFAREEIRPDNVKMRELSRLWSYRNGMSPRQKPPLLLVERGMIRTATL